LPERWVKAVSGCVFIVFGLLAIWGAVRAS
jgi:putative Ca2+/H+ antiporter (TMEM165/GDT1 family)